MNQLRVLVIAYTFPPAGGAGVQRTAKFVKYLPEFGWLPTVLTVTESCYGVQDASHTDDFPDSIKIIRTAHFDPVARFTRLPAAASSVNHQGSDNGDRTIAKRSRKQALRAVAGKAWMTFDKTLLIPDAAITWCPQALAAGLAAHLEHRFDLIYATGEPYSAYFTAAALSRLTGVPFVIDMRDPWTLSPYRQIVGSALLRNREVFLMTGSLFLKRR